MNTLVNFETAKLLKEKGFDELCSHAYKEVENPVLYIHQDKKYNNSFKKEWQNTVRKNSQMNNAVIKRYSAPTIAEVVMWLYDKHGIWIYTKPILDEDGNWIFKGYVKLMNNFKAKEYQTKLLRKPTEAYEAAIIYTLKNLL